MIFTHYASVLNLYCRLPFWTKIILILSVDNVLAVNRRI